MRNTQMTLCDMMDGHHLLVLPVVLRNHKHGNYVGMGTLTGSQQPKKNTEDKKNAVCVTTFHTRTLDMSLTVKNNRCLATDT